MIDKVDKYTLYGTRILVFLENSPQSNEYRQVYLNKEQFKKVSDAICTSIVPDGAGEEEVEIMMSVDTYKLPDLQEIHETLDNRK